MSNKNSKQIKESFLNRLESVFDHVEKESTFVWLKTPDVKEANKLPTSLVSIFEKLHMKRGTESFLKQRTSLRCDYFLPKQRIIIEVDERQHFTAPRAQALLIYPVEACLNFSKKVWIDTCKQINAKDNSPPYRDEQRAFYDSMRDLLPVENGMLPTFRVRLEEIIDKLGTDQVINRLKEAICCGYPSIKKDTEIKKIATLSFEKQGEDLPLTGKERADIIFDSLKAHKPDFMSTAGHSLDTKKDLENLAKRIGKDIDIKSVTLVEVQYDAKPKKHDINLEHVMYVIYPDGKIDDLGPQYFYLADQMDGDEGKLLRDKFEKDISQRIFTVGGKKCFALCCGELNIIEGVKCRSTVVEKVIAESDIIINPTHDRMGNDGILKNKRQFLSKKPNQMAISISNWNTKKEENWKKSPTGKRIIKQKSNADTLHTLYIGGSKQNATKYRDDEKNPKYELRIYEV